MCEFIKDLQSFFQVRLKKSKMVFWACSHCPTENRREDYVKALEKFVSVDIYGKCGNLSLCNGQWQLRDQCILNISSQYYFYLAFENSNCPNYISEKYWRTVRLLPVVPVVMGGADYGKLAPPHSYIDVNDFSTVEDLAKHLNYLRDNKVCNNQIHTRI